MKGFTYVQHLEQGLAHESVSISLLFHGQRRVPMVRQDESLKLLFFDKTIISLQNGSTQDNTEIFPVRRRAREVRRE